MTREGRMDILRRFALGTASALLVAGCGGSSGGHANTTRTTGERTLDTAKVARAIKASIRKQRDVKADVTCPARVRQAKGVDFVCAATAHGDATDFVVMQRDDAGNVSFEAAAPTK